MNSPASRPAQPTLLFIPDISGFTQFVNDTEITHSQHIIEELLEILIDANEIDLDVSEIEGDAILFYREGKPPTAPQLLAQVQRMYVDFHAHLKKYETHRICRCGACCAAINLSLKFVVHYGDIAHKQVKEYRKLFGKAVIVAHRLLKNQVPQEEYVLLTNPLMKACATWVHVEESAWAEVEHTEETYDFGAIEYCFIPLAPLHEYVPDLPPGSFGLTGETVKVLEFETVVEAPLETVFNILSDVSIRHEWIPGIQGSSDLTGKITRNGSTHRCVMGDAEKDPFFLSHSFEKQDNLITFVETEPRMKMNSVYTLQRIGKKLTRVQRHDHIPKRILGMIKYRLFVKKKMQYWVSTSWDSFKAYCAELEATGKQPLAQILFEPA